MKIATYNVNGIDGRLPRLLEWLGQARPDVACLQELKTADETFPLAAIRDAGYGALWVGQNWVERGKEKASDHAPAWVELGR